MKIGRPNPENKIEFSGGHRKAAVINDSSFPHIENLRMPAVNLTDFAYIVSYLENNSVMLHTPTMGRAGFYPISYEADGKVYNCLFVKGTGRSKGSVAEWNTAAPFYIPTQDERESGILLGYEPTFVGINSRKDQLRDAEMSRKLKALGIKCRVPLAGFYLEEIETEKGVEKVEQLVKDGRMAENERPYMSYWAMETPFRAEDLCEIVCEGDETQIREFMINAARYTQNVKDKSTEQFGKNLRSLIQEGAPTEKLLEQWTEFLLDQLEPQLEKMAAAGLLHKNLHTQNVSLHGEICDNGDMISLINKNAVKYGMLADINVFFDGFSKIWENFGRVKPIDPKYRTHFEEKVFAIKERFKNQKIEEQ
jgi:hypothetical protein